jgi:hypothetical protein
VTAVEPVEALTLAASEFRAFLHAHPRVALLLLEVLSRRLRDADRKRVEFAGRPGRGWRSRCPSPRRSSPAGPAPRVRRWARRFS